MSRAIRMRSLVPLLLATTHPAHAQLEEVALIVLDESGVLAARIVGRQRERAKTESSEVARS